ncbi:MAG: DMT family protein [Thermoguttaceae bacterium]
MKAFQTILLLVISNTFMTFAWYGHLKLKDVSWIGKLSLPAIVLLSWGIALLEYSFMIPANRIGYSENGGPFNMWQLKVTQEAITLVVFIIFTTLLFKNQPFRLNHCIGFAFLVLAVFFIFKK